MKYIVIMTLSMSSLLFAMESDQDKNSKTFSKIGQKVKNLSIERFRRLNNGESLTPNQEVAFRDASPKAPLRYAVVKEMLNKKTCFVGLGNRDLENRKKIAIGRSISMDQIYVRKGQEKILGNKSEYSAEQVRPVETITLNDLFLYKTGTENEYQWVKVRTVLPDNQYAILITRTHGEVCRKKDLFTLMSDSGPKISDPKIMNSASTP